MDAFSYNLGYFLQCYVHSRWSSVDTYWCFCFIIFIWQMGYLPRRSSSCVLESRMKPVMSLWYPLSLLYVSFIAVRKRLLTPVSCFDLNPFMLRLLLSEAQGCKNLWKPSKPYHVGIHWIALIECSQMSTHLLGFQSFFRFLHYFVLAKLATSIIRVNPFMPENPLDKCHLDLWYFSK